jgi:hypothetical protein
MFDHHRLREDRGRLGLVAPNRRLHIAMQIGLYHPPGWRRSRWLGV